MKSLSQDSSVNQLHDSEPRWFAIYVQYRHEKKVKKLLDFKEIDSYLPLQQVTRRYPSKIKKLEIPLINCYLFVKITKAQYIKVLETEDVLRFVRVKRDLFAIPEKEIDMLRKVAGDYDFPIEATAETFQLGQKVEIIAGQLTGLQGNLVQKDNQERFYVQLNSIGMGLMISIDSKNLSLVLG